jgi:hypothetical protein
MKSVTHAIRRLLNKDTYRPILRRYNPNDDDLIADWDETLHRALESAEYTQRTGLPFDGDLFPAHAPKERAEP